MKALIVDDSRTIRVVLGKMLKEVGFEVLEASNGQEALDQIKAVGKVDIALVDWNMPVMNGLDFIKAVRNLPEYSDAWLMMVTTETEQSQMVKAMVAGANEYVMKPFTKEVIFEKLQMMGLLPAQE